MAAVLICHYAREGRSGLCNICFSDPWRAQFHIMDFLACQGWAFWPNKNRLLMSFCYKLSFVH